MEYKINKTIIEGTKYYVILIPRGYKGMYKLFNHVLYDTKKEAEHVAKNEVWTVAQLRKSAAF